jgi:Xaa-Pro dipeptidase
MDCGCSVEGYQSDISRTFVFGEPTTRSSAGVGPGRAASRSRSPRRASALRPAASTMRCAANMRRWGYGPRYKLPGTSHRTGHGIGMDGHEPVNLVHGETTRLAPGMCFSNEPGIYLPGKFGIRLEDCFHMTEAGPAGSRPRRPRSTGPSD